MTRVAAFDCGTNSLRLLVADVHVGRDGDAATDVHREMRVVRLGEGVDRTGELAPQALERVRTALTEQAALCRELGVEATRLVATSATRDARNRHLFVELVTRLLGVAPVVATGAQEAALSFAGATRGLPAGDGPFLVVDIGGGSTEFVLGGAEVEAALSVDVGCVRLTERHLHDDPPTPEQAAAARGDVDRSLDRVLEHVPVARARTAVGVAGTVTTVAAVAHGLPTYDADRIHLSRLTADEVRETADRLLAMTRAQRAALPVMHPGRVDVIGAGALLLRAVVDRLALPGLVVSEHDILDGIAWSVARDTSGAGDGGPEHGQGGPVTRA